MIPNNAIGFDYTGTLYIIQQKKSLWIMNGKTRKLAFPNEKIYFLHTPEAPNRKVVKTFEEMFDTLPPEEKEIILWNLDIWMLNSVESLSTT